MGTEPEAKRPTSPFVAWSIGAAAGLAAIAVLPKQGGGGDLAVVLGWLEIILLVVLSLSWVFPKITRSRLGCLVQAFLGVAAVSAAVVGSIFLVLVTCANTGGLR